MSRLFTEDNKISIGLTTASGASATGTATTAAIDMSGFDGCCFLVAVGPVTSGAATSLKLTQSDATAGTYSDVTGSSITIGDTDDNFLKYLDVFRPTKQFLKLAVSRATQVSTIGSILAVQYKARSRPVTQGTNVAGETCISQTEGTA